MKRILRILVPLVVIAAAGFWAWSAFVAAPEDDAPITVAVTRGDVSETVLASGVMEAMQLVSVGARVSGQIETVAVSLGDDVAAGDLIAQIESSDQQNDLLQAKANLAQVEAQIAAKDANLHKAEVTLARKEQLVMEEYTSRQEYESAEADLLVLKAELKALEAQKSHAEVTVSMAETALARTTITAPIDGTVVAIVVDEGQTVNATNATPTIAKLANLDQMVVKAEISEADVVHVRPGQAVTFTILGGAAHEYDAVVGAIAPAPAEIDQSDTISTDKAIYYDGLFVVDNPDHVFRIGMTTEVTITLDRADDVLTIPSSALKSDGAGGRYVEVLDPQSGEIRTAAVDVGLDDKIVAEITSGLGEGDQVVMSNGGPLPAARTNGTGARAMPPPRMF